MAKHTITVEANGNTYKVETDADIISIDGVEFKFPTTVVPVAVPQRAVFVGSQIEQKRIYCIRAVREASQNSSMSFDEACFIVKTGKFFTVHPDSRNRFENYCQANKIEPMYDKRGISLPNQPNS